jgi:cardiolipin synthase
MSRLSGLRSHAGPIIWRAMADASPPSDPAITADVAGNRLRILAEGPQRMDALLELIDGAQETLRILFYIFLDDRSGVRVRDALIAAAARGVDVALLVDGFGSGAASDAFFQPLIDSDVRFCRFSARWGRRYLLRNHQKLALADGVRVITGGFNVADDYFGTAATQAWRDLGIHVEGPSVSCLVRYFDQLFDWTQKPRGRIRELRRVLHQSSTTEGKLHWLFGGPTRRLSPWARAVRKDMSTARRIDMIAAYFAPSPGMMRRIAGVARRGRARVITAAKSDNDMTIAAARNTYWWMLKRGVDVYEYLPTKLHTKLFVIDDTVHVGSANFDMRSLFLNLELMLRIDDPGFAASMHRYVNGEVANCEQITPAKHRARRTLLNRLQWAIAYFAVAVADYRISRVLNFGADGK